MGEVRLFNTNLEVTYDNLESSYSLINRLNELYESQDSHLENEIEKIKETFLPIIQVQSIRSMHDAKEIIVENLNYRLLQERRDEMFKNSKFN